MGGGSGLELTTDINLDANHGTAATNDTCTRMQVCTSSAAACANDNASCSQHTTCTIGERIATEYCGMVFGAIIRVMPASARSCVAFCGVTMPIAVGGPRVERRLAMLGATCGAATSGGLIGQPATLAKLRHHARHP